MIIPARWYAGGKGLDKFREDMLKDNRIREIHDFPYTSDVFRGVQLEGGVCYFKWEIANPGLCKIYNHAKGRISISERPLLEPGSEIFIRYNEAIQIFHKVRRRNEPSMKNIVSRRNPFGFRSDYFGAPEPFPGAVKLYLSGGIGWVSRSKVKRNVNWIDLHKVYISSAYRGSEFHPVKVLGTPIYGEPNSCCTETYIVIGPFSTKQEAVNAITYIQCRLFRFLVLLKKITQHASKKVYGFVPIQDFSKPWTDEELYEKYGLTDDEIEFIEKLIRPMNACLSTRPIYTDRKAL
jgi:site-specific DNA-methyltransferase (adenine-specific)